jgi:uncharacterized phage protein gp47/JayE
MNIPTAQQLYTAILADLEAELNITIPAFGRSYLKAKAMVQAGRLWLLYLVMAAIQKNIFVDTCDEETLIRFGRVKLGRDPFPATQAQYTALVTGTTGSVIAASTTFKANDDSQSPGKLFVLDTEFILDGTNIITLRALEAGTDSQLNVVDKLTATAPIALVGSEVVVQSEVIQPQAAEDIEDYRENVIIAFRLEPQGGSPADYRLWSVEVQGIIQAYPFAKSGATSEINLFIESDEPDGVPTPTDLQNVEDSIELPTDERPARKPITAIVNYLPITPKDIAITITDFVDLTPEKEVLIDSAIESLLSDIRPFVGAIDVVADKNDYLDLNLIISTILAAVPGSIFNEISMTVDGAPTTSITFTDGNIPTLLSITYDY